MSNSRGFSINTLFDDGNFEQIYSSSDSFYNSINTAITNSNKFLFKSRDKFIVRESNSISVIQKNANSRSVLDTKTQSIKEMTVYEDQIYYSQSKNVGILNIVNDSEKTINFESEISQLESFLD